MNFGVMLYDFKTLSTEAGAIMDGTEIDLYAFWAINEHWWVMPLVGRYDPEASASSGGTQLGDSDANYYTQLLLGFNF